MRRMFATILLAAASASCHAGDFDWVLSTWYAKSHRQVKAADGSLTWSDGMLVQTARPWLGSDIGHVDEVRVDGKLAGSSVRLHDLANDRWSDYWVSAADGRLQDPMWGKADAHGSVFFGADVVDGRPVRVRYTWSGVDTPHPRWVQAFSRDEGRTWTTTGSPTSAARRLAWWRRPSSNGAAIATLTSCWAAGRYAAGA